MQGASLEGESRKRNENVEKVRPTKGARMSPLALGGNWNSVPLGVPEEELRTCLSTIPPEDRNAVQCTYSFLQGLKVTPGRMTPTFEFSPLCVRLPGNPETTKPRVAAP